MKRSRFARPRLLLIGSCLLVVALSVTLSTSVGRAAPAPQMHGHNYGAWSYTATRSSDHGRLEAAVRYDNSSIAGLRAYADANRILANQLARSSGEIEVQITFSTPMDPVKFRSWATNVGLTVQAADIRTVNAKGRRSTIAVFPRGSDPLPQAIIDRQLARNLTIDPLTIRGVVDARGTIDATRLPSVVADTNVFLADVTPSVIRRDLSNEGEVDATQTLVQVQPPFWALEDLGLDNFR